MLHKVTDFLRLCVHPSMISLKTAAIVIIASPSYYVCSDWSMHAACSILLLSLLNFRNVKQFMTNKYVKIFVFFKFNDLHQNVLRTKEQFQII